MLKVAAAVAFNKFPQISGEMRDRLETLVEKTTHDVEAHVKVSMQAPKHGREYRRGKRMHRASAPGEAPAVDYGNLINSIQTEFPNPMSGYVYTTAEYALPLEFGSVRMAARPFMIPATEAQKAAFLRAVGQIIRG